MPSTMYLAHLAPEQIKRNAECEALLVQRIHEQLQSKDYPPEKLGEWAKVLDGIKRSNVGLERNNISVERLDRVSRPRSRFASRFSSGGWNPDLACIRPGSAVTSAPPVAPAESPNPAPQVPEPRVDPSVAASSSGEVKPPDAPAVTQSTAPPAPQAVPPVPNASLSVQAIARNASNPVPPTVSDEDFRLPLNWNRRLSLVAAAREIYGLDLRSWLTDPNLQPNPRHRDVVPDHFYADSRQPTPTTMANGSNLTPAKLNTS